MRLAAESPHLKRIIDVNSLFMMPESVVLHTDPQLQFLHHVSVDDFCVGSRAALAGDMTVVNAFTCFCPFRFLLHSSEMRQLETFFQLGWI